MYKLSYVVRVSTKDLDELKGVVMKSKTLRRLINQARASLWGYVGIAWRIYSCQQTLHQ